MQKNCGTMCDYFNSDDGSVPCQKNMVRSDCCECMYFLPVDWICSSLVLQNHHGISGAHSRATFKQTSSAPSPGLPFLVLFLCLSWYTEFVYSLFF